MNLICDILGKQLVDREGRNLGKIEGIIVELRANQPPRVKYLAVGAVVLGRRLHRRVAKRLERWVFALPRGGRFSRSLEKGARHWHRYPGGLGRGKERGLGIRALAEEEGDWSRPWRLTA